MTHFFEVKQSACLLTLSLFLLLFTHYQGIAQDENSDTSCDQLYEWVLIPEKEDSALSKISFYETDLLTQFYTQQNCRAVWYDNQKQWMDIDAFLQVLRSTRQHRYHLAAIEKRYTEVRTLYEPSGLFDFNKLDILDVLLSDAALHYAHKLWQDARIRQGKAPITDVNSLSALNDELSYVLEGGAVVEFYAALQQGDIKHLEQTAVVHVEAEKNLAKSRQDSLIQLKSQPVITVDDIEKDEKTPKVPTVNDRILADYVKFLSDHPDSLVLDEKIYRVKELANFYKDNNYSPIWHDGKETNPIVEQLMRSVATAEAEGLNPDDYHFPKLSELYQALAEIYKNKQIPLPVFLTETELLFTDAALHYGQHLRTGKVNIDSLGLHYDVKRERENLNSLLQTTADQRSIPTFFEYAKPKHPMYARLKKQLAEAKKDLTSKGEHKAMATGRMLQLGMSDNRVPALRERLGIPAPKPPVVKKDSTTQTQQALKVDSLYNPMAFDSTLYKAVFDFQQKHGLGADGIVGSQTIAALNTPKTERIEQIKVNLERWRWLAHNLGDRYIFVNIPAFKLYVMEKGDAVGLEKKVMVGKAYTSTPVFSDNMDYIEVNPYWNVPFSIATKEILPILQRNPSYLVKENMQVLSRGKALNPYAINWKGLNKSNFRYQIRQKPGRKNALGLIKFMFPNRYNVYIHDTQSKSLFSKSVRAFSHGCIRLEKPKELAEYLLAPKYSKQDIADLFKAGKNKKVRMPYPLPVFITYFTSWVDEQGNLRFGPDIYERDEAVKVQLGKN